MLADLSRGVRGALSGLAPRLAASLGEQEATPAQRRTAAVVCIAYAVIALALVPFAPVSGWPSRR